MAEVDRRMNETEAVWNDAIACRPVREGEGRRFAWGAMSIVMTSLAIGNVIALNTWLGPRVFAQSDISTPPPENHVLQAKNHRNDASDSSPSQTLRPLHARPATTIVPNLLFARGESALHSGHRLVLQAALDRIRATPSRQILTRGHTDQTGSTAWNRELSYRRARAVARFLEARGVSRDRISVEGFGGEQPIDPSGTPEAHENNRRVELLWR
jgi:outer membrane protein OmpA-like peptidoglycan-associated protein